MMMRRSALLACTGAVAMGVLRCTSEARIGGDERDAEADVATLSDVAATAETSLAEVSDAGDASDAAVAAVAGTYSLLLRAGDNGCAFAVWTVGSVADATATLQQLDASVSAEVQGLAAVTFGLLLGTTHLDGRVTGTTLSLQATGTNVAMLDGGTCAHTVDARVVARATDGALQDGVVVFERRFVDSVACARFACTSVESLTGLRQLADP